jgi:hypothetical protein
MRRLLFVLMLIVIIATVGPAVSASASTGGAGVTGTGMLGQFGDPLVQVSASQAGSTGAGEFTIAYPDRSFVAGRVTCLFVAGNTAYLTGQITRSGGPRQQPENWLPGRYIVIGIQDNSPPRTAGPDNLNFSPGFADNPGCGPNIAAVPVFPIVWGNYVVSGHN